MQSLTNNGGSMKKSNGFCYAHFPAGTICEVTLTHRQNQKFNVEVTTLSKNGADSYVIETTLPGDVTDFFGCNIDHVTRIIKRGKGGLVWAKHRTYDFMADYVGAIGDAYAELGKHPSQYLTYEPRQLVAHLIRDRQDVDTMLDFDVLMGKLWATGVFTECKLNDGWGMPYVKANKKRLKKTVFKLLNKCLITKKAAVRYEQELDHEMMMRDLELDEKYYGAPDDELEEAA
jgi:hypothetical protein